MQRGHREEVTNIVSHDGLGAPVQSSFQYKFIVRVAKLWTIPEIDFYRCHPIGQISQNPSKSFIGELMDGLVLGTTHDVLILQK